jgi:ABC-2 type transport system permease protein
MNTYIWLIRREFWENRAIWMVPAVISAALVFAALFGRVEIMMLTSPEQNRSMAAMVLFAFGVIFFAVMSLYCTWYLLDCLYADRKDRSVLFWKSLPISDTATVFTKLFMGLIVIPVVYFLAADLSSLIMAFIISLRVRSTFGSALWRPDLWLQLQVLWLYVIVTTAIWYLPVAGWLMLVSAWAKRAVTLWSILPPLAVILAERLFLGSHLFGSLLRYRLLGYIPLAFYDLSHRAAWATTIIGGDDHLTTPTSVWALLNPAGFFSSPATWEGVVVGAALIFGAIQLRLRRTEV